MHNRIALVITLCALRTMADTEIIGWGTQATIPSEIRTATAVAAGDSHTVALLNNGTTTGWGSSSITDNRYAPFTASDLSSHVHQLNGPATAVIKVCAGWSHTSYWLNNQMVVTRGANNLSQIGVFPFTSGNADPPNSQIIDVACGANFTAVAYWRPSSGTYSIKVWGQITSGGPTGHRLIQTTDINVNNPAWSFSFPVTKIAGGSAHLVWVMNSGTSGVVTGVGDFNAIPQNGNPNNSGAVKLTAGNNCTLWLKANGNAYGVGNNHSGFISGNNSDISAGVGHELMLKTIPAGTVTATAYSLPEGNQGGQANVPAFLGGVLAVSAGRFHSVAVVTRKEKPVVEFTITGPGTGLVEWPSTYPEYNQVYESSDVAGPYTLVPGTQTVVSGKFRLPVTFTGTQWFYRLKRTY